MTSTGSLHELEPGRVEPGQRAVHVGLLCAILRAKGDEADDLRVVGLWWRLVVGNGQAA